MPKWLSTLVLLSNFKFELIKIVKFWVILLSWIRIRILNADPDPDPADQNKCGSMRIRIRNTAGHHRKVLYRCPGHRGNVPHWCLGHCRTTLYDSFKTERCLRHRGKVPHRCLGHRGKVPHRCLGHRQALLQALCNIEGLSQVLKGQSHEIFCIRFFSSNSSFRSQ